MLRSKIQLTCLLLIVSIGTITAQTQAKLIPKKGLFLETNGLTWGMGSEVNFFTSDRKQHHYYFTWWEQDILVDKPNDTRLELGSRNTAIYGIYQLERNENNIRTWIDCKWNRSDTGVAEITFVRIWKPYFREAQWKDAKGKEIRDWKQFTGKKLIAYTPFGDFEFNSQLPFKVRVVEKPDPGPTDHAQRSQYLEFYEDNIIIDSTRLLQRSFLIEVLDEKENKETRTGIKYVEPQSVSKTWEPKPTKKNILPQPEQLDRLSGAYTFPLEHRSAPDSVGDALRELIALQWQLGEQHHPFIEVIKNDQLSDQEYRIDVTTEKIRIECDTDTALQYALHTLAQSVEIVEGRVRIPCMKVADKPKTSWRGIHMFTGPTALDLHTRMYQRVLFPLKMNKAVIQCEQAQWKSFPEIHNPISVSLNDLRTEFELLRKNRVEPIPLIQSLGHMEWFFKPKSTRWLAINPQYPYTLNTDLPEAKEAIRKIWNEAIELLNPSTLHVGFDEIGMIGFNLPRDKGVSLFRDQLSFLDRYAKTNNKKLMIWGDMGLAPGEGPDACNGINPSRSKAIREAIPPGTYVADWHYLNNPDPSVYKKNLQIWKENQNIPLASPWLWPNNVHGFVKAAIDEKAGILQTTWADFESNEKNMLINIEQFGAYVLALDYAWSGRKEMPDQLPYDPIREWTRRFYDRPKPLLPRDGYRLADSLVFKDITSSVNNHRSNKISLILDKAYSVKGLTCQTISDVILPEGTPVAEIELYEKESLIRKIPLRYAAEIRARTDRRPVHSAIDGQDPHTYWHFWEKEEKVDRIRINLIQPGGGLNLKNLQLIKTSE